MFEISDSFISSNPLIAIILLVVCGLMWKVLGLAFDKLTKSKDKENDAFISQLKEVADKLNDNADKLTEVISDLRVAIERIAHHDNMLDGLYLKAERHENTLAKHETRISVLETIKKLEKY